MATNQLWVSANYSYDGSKVVYVSDFDFLYPGTDHNGRKDIYVVDLVDGLYPGDPQTHRKLVSVASNGTQHNSSVDTASFSPDGTKVVFSSTATFGDVQDLGGYGDVFVRDLVAGTTTRVSTDSDGFQFIFASGLYGGSGVNNPVFSPDGKSVMFDARASQFGFGEIYLKNLETGKLSIVSSSAPTEFAPDGIKGDLTSSKASFSYDGELVIFESAADNLDDLHQSYGNTDIFVKNIKTGAIQLISRASGIDGAAGNKDSGRGFIDAGAFGGISEDGEKAIFISSATNLVTGDTNGSQDVFIRDLKTNTTTRVSLTSDGTQANGNSWDAKISPDGTKIVFASFATNLVSGNDANNDSDVFLKDLITGEVIRLSDVIGNKPGEGSRFAHFSPDGGVVIWQTNVQHLDNTNDYTEQYYTYVLPGPINGNDKDNTKPGTARPDTINGLGGNDKLFGLGAGDSLDGGAGKDTMTGGQGDDFYVVDNKGDVVDEKAPGSAGRDTVQSSITFSLDGSTVKGKVENLMLTGKTDLAGTGNDLANALTGNKGDNVFKGGGGNDTIKGGGGKDAIDGGGGTDVADYSDKKKAIEVTLKASAGTVEVGGKAEDTLKNIEGVIGGSKNDKITGDSKANILDGGAGKDTLTGGDGKDKFLFNSDIFTAPNVDTITDFKHGTDKIVLAAAIFYELGTSLSADELGVKKSGHAAAEGQFLIYDKSKGTLWYDYDGVGIAEAIQIAVLSPKVSTLSVADFEVA
ncbi:MAG: hypothetical protein ABIY37_13435 [Devosia sp.]